MRNRTASALIAIVALLGIAAADPLALLAEMRSHVHKIPEVSQAVPTESLGKTPCVDGMAGPFPCDGIDLLSFTPISEFAGLPTYAPGLNSSIRGSDVWGWTSPETGDEYVLFGKTNGVAFFRVTDPTAPVYLGTMLNTAAAQLVWQDIKVYDNKAYAVSESNPHGMQIFDLFRLDGVTDAQDWVMDSFYPLNVAAHNLAINEETGFAYIVGGNAGLAAEDQCRAGLHIVDLKTPVPTFAGCYVEEGGVGVVGSLVGPLGALSRYVHDTECVVYRGPDADWFEHEICFNSSETHVAIVDVTDKLAPSHIATVEYDRTEYAHQGWLTDDGRHFLMGDELDEDANAGMPTRTLVFDVEDLDNPTWQGTHYGQSQSIDHNMYIRDGLVYQSNYASGLRVVDLYDIDDVDNDPTNGNELEEVAYFDVFPDNDGTSFSGTWSNYPYFDSGTVVISGYDGLWLVKVQDEVFDDIVAARPDHDLADR